MGQSGMHIFSRPGFSNRHKCLCMFLYVALTEMAEICIPFCQELLNVIPS